MKDEHRADHRQLDVALTLTRIRKLQDDRRYRDQHRLFFIEGVRNFVEAVDHKFPIETLLYSRIADGCLPYSRRRSGNFSIFKCHRI